MGTVQKVQELSKMGKVNIQARQFENEKGVYFWYFVSFESDMIEVNSEMPTLVAAIESVYIQVCKWNMNINMKYDNWIKLVSKGVRHESD